MIIDKNIYPFIVFSEDSIINALRKISENKTKFILSVNESGVLEGVLTDGDFRHWLLNQETIDLHQPASAIINKNFIYASIDDEPEKITAYFSKGKGIEFIPILDQRRHLIAIARKGSSGVIRIADRIISDESPAFIIAEIGINHSGSLTAAKNMIDKAVVSGADCAKFQMRNLKALYYNSGDPNDAREDLGSQYTMDLLTRFQLSSSEMFEAFDYCKQQGIIPLCTPWDIESLRELEDYGMDAYKLASADLTNHDLLIAMAKTGKPMLCSTGMSKEQEITEAVQILKGLGAAYVLLHCNSTYPAPFKDVNLNYLERLKEIGGCLVGYSGHERGYSATLAAVAKGAKVIEKHFTLDKTTEGIDHKVSLLPEEFRAMVTAIREVEQSMGKASERKLSQGEMINRETLAKSLIINCDLEPGQTIMADMIETKGPGKGLQPNYKKRLVGLKARRSFHKDDFFFLSDLDDDKINARHYIFKRPWGIPVRYHDYKTLMMKSNPGLLEFHLSYKDLDLDINNYFHDTFDLDLVVHSPELFSGDHILNLCTTDEAYRQRSIHELQRVINVTRKIAHFFKKAARVCIVTNVGGFTMDAALHTSQRAPLYHLLLDSLSSLDMRDVEIIPQTMPPFPWHFGGQRYHNLFVDPEDIVEFCRSHQYRICLDISHSKLSCNHNKQPFSDFLEAVGPYAAHMHIADARGLDGEGLQIGQGEIDFSVASKILDTAAPGASFIPEIWQGHKNEGEECWRALELMEKHF